MPRLNVPPIEGRVFLVLIQVQRESPKWNFPLIQCAEMDIGDRAEIQRVFKLGRSKVRIEDARGETQLTINHDTGEGHISFQTDEGTDAILF